MLSLIHPLQAERPTGLPIPNSKRIAPPRERHVTVGFVLSAAILSTASLVVLNMHQRNPLALIIVAGLAATAMVATTIRLIIVKVRDVSFQRTTDQYVGMLARARRESEAAEEARLLAWEKKRSGSAHQAF